MTHADPDRETLLMLARSGDRAALADLLEEVAPELRSRLEPKITGEVRAQLDPDDVMQVTYIEALLRLETFREGGAADSSRGCSTWPRTT